MTTTTGFLATPRDPRNWVRTAIGNHVAWGQIHDRIGPRFSVHRWWAELNVATLYVWIGH